MVTINRSVELSDILPPLFMQRYIVLMIVAVTPETLVDSLHHGAVQKI